MHGWVPITGKGIKARPIAWPALITALLALAGSAVVAAPAAGPGVEAAGQSYFDGLLAGEAQGREEGRTLEIGQSLPAGEREAVEAAFKAGYGAGANDVFGGYDGGWAMAAPYVVTLAAGSGPITYRIGRRTPVEPGIAYFLCPDGHSLCQAARN
jgi:hypothetical protein